MGPPVNSARRGRAAGSSRTPTPTGLRETYAGAETVGSAKPSRRAGVEPRPYGNAGGTISDPPVGVGVLDDPPSRHAPTPRSRTTPNNAQNRRGGDGTPLLHEIQTPKAFHRFPRDCWRRCGLFPHRRRQSIFLIDAALRAAATLFSIVTQDGQRRIFQRSQPTAPKRRIGLPRSVGEAGGTLPVRWAHTPNKSRFSLGRHSRFFWQGQKKWGGILTHRLQNLT